MRWNPQYLIILFASLVACSTDQCSCTAFEQRAFPTRGLDASVPAAGQARVTSSGLKFVEGQVPYLIDQFVPGGLNFCIPQDTSGNPDICVASTCPGGQAGCPVDLTIDDQSIRPKPPNQLEVSVTIGDVDERLNFDYGTFIGTVNCYVQLFKKGSSESTAGQIVGTIPIDLSVDGASPTKELRVEIGDPALNLDGIDFKIHGRGNVGDTIACEGASLVRGLFRGLIESQVQTILRDTVDQIADEQLCRRCGTGFDACSAGSCTDGICRYASNACVPRPLGVEGRLNLGSLLADYVDEPNASVDVLAKAGDVAKVDSGVSVGLRAGFEPNAFAPCVPVDPTKRPSSLAIPVSPVINADTDPDGQPFHLGVGIHKRALEHMLWSTWASGAGCLKVGSETVSLLTTGTFQLVASSLKDLGPGGRTASLVVVPQKAPTLEFGANRITQTNGTYAIDSPLLLLKWPDIDFHVFGYAQERMLRLFSIRVDLELPVALSPDGQGNLIPVVGAIEDAIKNIRPRRTELISEGPQRILDLVPTLVGFAAPQLAGAIPESIGVPEFLGFRLALEQGDIRGADNNAFLALFATLERSGQPFVYRPDTSIGQVTVDMSTRLPSGLVRPTVTLSAFVFDLEGARDYEYQWRVDGGFWSMFQDSGKLEIDDPVLAIPGDHVIEVRARIAGEMGTLDGIPASTIVRIEPPPLMTVTPADVAPDELDVAIQTYEPPPVSSRAAGCDAANGGASWLLLLVLPLLRLRRRRGVIAAAALVVMMSGCKGEVATNATTRCFGPECQVDRTCSMDADCGGLCPAGTSGICENNQCQCVRACEGGCAADEFCCIGSSTCVAAAPSCDGRTCDEGYEPRIVGEPNRETCEIDGGGCECVPLPPVPIGVHGQFASVDHAGGVTYVAAYNKTYGDLMVGRVETDATITWSFADGVPASGPLTGDPNGLRGGLSEKGVNVGTYTALVVDDSGTAHVIYRDEDAKALKYARGRVGEAFETTVVESEGNPMWVSAVRLGNVMHAIYGVDEVAGKSALRHMSFDLTGAIASVTPALQTIEETDVDATETTDFPRRQGMFTDLSATPQGGLQAVWYNGITKRVGRSTFTTTWSAPEYVAANTGPYAAAAVDDAGDVHMVFMTGSGLRYSRFGSMVRTALVHDGRRDADEYYNGPIGEDVDVRVVGGDDVRVVFQDAFDRALYEARWNGDGFDLAKVPLPAAEAGGFYTAFSPGGDVYVDWLIDRTAEPWGRLRVLPLSL
ncbi:MAG: hypothetical protein R3E66_02375 [bacterium]